MKISFTILQLGLLSSTLFAQPKFDLDGYVVNVPACLRLNETLSSLFALDRNSWMDVSRLRMRPMMHWSENGYFALEYEADLTYQSEPMLRLVPAAAGRREYFDLSWELEKSDRWQMMHGIDRLYLRQELGVFDISVGRQRIAWGSGRIWNPTDLFNPINPTTFSKIEKDGVDAASLKMTLGTLSDITLVYNPQRDGTNNFGMRLRSNYREFDISGIAGYFDQRVIIGGDVAGNLFEAGIRSELIISMQKNNASRNYVKAIVGADYQWTEKLYTLLEYHYNGQGEQDPARYDLSRLLSGEVLNVGVNYLAVSASYLVHPLATAAVTCMTNLDDNSTFAAWSLVYFPTDATSLTLGGQIFRGDLLDEYWYYPGSLYLKTELFF